MTRKYSDFWFFEFYKKILYFFLHFSLNEKIWYFKFFFPDFCQENFFHFFSTKKSFQVDSQSINFVNDFQLIHKFDPSKLQSIPIFLFVQPIFFLPDKVLLLCKFFLKIFFQNFFLKRKNYVFPSPLSPNHPRGFVIKPIMIL